MSGKSFSASPVKAEPGTDTTAGEQEVCQAESSVEEQTDHDESAFPATRRLTTKQSVNQDRDSDGPGPPVIESKSKKKKSKSKKSSKDAPTRPLTLPRRPKDAYKTPQAA